MITRLPLNTLCQVYLRSFRRSKIILFKNKDRQNWQLATIRPWTGLVDFHLTLMIKFLKTHSEIFPKFQFPGLEPDQGSKSRQKSCTMSCTTKIVLDSDYFHDKIFVVHDFLAGSTICGAFFEVK